MSDNPWVVGAEVIRAFNSLGRRRWGNVVKIEKVYKNGNVVIGSKQYRPDNFPAAFSGEWYATATGGSTYRRDFVVLLTDSVRDAMKADRAVDRAKSARRALATLLEGMSDDACVQHEAAIVALFEAIAPKDEASA